MATVHGVLEQPVNTADATIRRAASELGYALAEGQGAPGTLVFKKGVSAFSWGSRVTVTMAAATATATRLTLETGETFAITDWGRGRRAAQRLLTSAGATIVSA